MTQAKIEQVKPSREKKWVYQDIQEQIKAYILNNALSPGDMLPTETQLAQLFGASRNSVREAVKALEAVGILEAKRGEGLMVAPFTIDRFFDNLAFGSMFGAKNIIDTLELRFQLEYGMAESLVHDVTTTQLQKLGTTLEQMQESIRGGIWSVDADRDFHSSMWANLENELISKILDVFWKAYHQLRQESKPLPEDKLKMFYGQHLEIVNALKKRDPKAMKLSIVHHYINPAFMQVKTQQNGELIDLSMARYYIALTYRSNNMPGMMR